MSEQSLEEALGIDYSKPEDRQARDLVEADERFLDDLIAAREASGLTPDDVAQRMGASLLGVAQIELKRDPRLSALRRYAHAIGVTYKHEVER